MPKRTQLVCQHLENLSRDALENQYQYIVRKYVRHQHGVYALYRRGKLYYVGLASNLRSRLTHHLKDHHHDSWDRFSVYMTIGNSHMRELESLILRIVKPPGNKQKGKFANSKDLRPSFKRDWNVAWDDERDRVLGEPPKTAPRQRTTTKADGRKPVLAEYITGPFTLRAHYKGKTLRAFVRKSGRIRFAGNNYTSPSVAGARAVKRPTCNGWVFWQYERAPGDWVPLDNLRK
jgi:hypothetical protein